MSIKVIIKDPYDNTIEFVVDRSITIGELRNLYSSKGGEGSSQMKISGEIISDDKRLEDYIFNKNSKKITICCVNAVRGGGDTNVFANLSDDYITQSNVTKFNDPRIPDWRVVAKGINLYGICENSKCKAKGKQVIMNVESKEIDLYKENFMGKCPMCGKHFDLDTCGFYFCDYKLEGSYFDKEVDDWVNLPEDTKSTRDQKESYYDPSKIVEGKQSKVKYNKLILKVINIHNNE